MKGYAYEDYVAPTLLSRDYPGSAHGRVVPRHAGEQELDRDPLQHRSGQRQRLGRVDDCRRIGGGHGGAIFFFWLRVATGHPSGGIAPAAIAPWVTRDEAPLRYTSTQGDRRC